MQMIGKTNYTEANSLADIKAFGKETLGKEDFEVLMLPIVKRWLVIADPRPLELKRIFEEVDADKNGYLSVDELEICLNKCSETKFSKEDTVKIFNEFDKDQDNKLCF